MPVVVDLFKASHAQPLYSSHFQLASGEKRGRLHIQSAVPGRGSDQDVQACSEEMKFLPRQWFCLDDCGGFVTVSENVPLVFAYSDKADAPPSFSSGRRIEAVDADFVCRNRPFPAADAS